MAKQRMQEAQREQRIDMEIVVDAYGAQEQAMSWYYYLEEKYPSFGNLVPRDVASRNAKTVVEQGFGVGPLKNGVYLDFADAIARDGRDTIEEKYGNLLQMYERITGEDPYLSLIHI